MSADGSGSWEPVLSNYTSLIQEIRENPKGNLKFDLPYIKVSDIKQQYYCEQQVELKKIHGEAESEQTKLGTDAHERLLEGSVSIKDEDAIRKIFTSKQSLTFREMRLVAKHKGVNILGQADYVHFDKGLPLLVLDYKFKQKVAVYDNELLQAGLYSYLLNKMGFDTSRLKYGVVAADSTLKDNVKLIFLPNLIRTKYPNQKYIDLTVASRQVAVVITEFSPEKVVKDLDWALPFWMKQRDAIPTKMKAKCNKCDFKDTCDFSLARVKV